jgi:hypothetical protein
MARKAPGVMPTEPPANPIPAADAAACIYRDRAGPARSGGPSEGAVNFAAITANARALITEEPADGNDH